MLVMKVSLTGLSDFAKKFLAELPKTETDSAHIVGLSGELGAGKTAFVQEVAKALGLSAPVTSPTFILARVYPINRPPFSRLVHIDAYRLSAEEKDTFGWGEYAKNPKNLIFAEWPERLPGGVPKGARVLRFAVTGEETREITESYA